MLLTFLHEHFCSPVNLFNELSLFIYFQTRVAEVYLLKKNAGYVAVDLLFFSGESISKEAFSDIQMFLLTLLWNVQVL